MPTEKKRMGRPLKNPGAPRRVSLGLKVTPQIKELIDTRARASGRTQSQEAEFLVERSVQFDRALADMNQSMEEIKRGNLEAELYRAGYELRRHPEYGKYWLGPGFPGARSGFIPQPEESEKK